MSGSRSRGKRTAGESWPADRKLDVVLQGMRKRRPVKELCRQVGISPTSYYHWQHQVIDAARTGLVHPEAENHALKEQIRQLEAENAKLQRQVSLLKDLCTAD
jgi:transposase-like protein